MEQMQIKFRLKTVSEKSCLQSNVQSEKEKKVLEWMASTKNNWS